MSNNVENKLFRPLFVFMDDGLVNFTFI